MGNDTLIGGSGVDVLVGDRGNDRFLFNIGTAFNTSALGIDTMSDFTSTLDKIVLSKKTFTAISSIPKVGFSNGSEFAIVNNDNLAATNAADIIYNSANGKLSYNQNGVAAGLGSGAQFATLSGNPSIVATDFEIIA